MSIVRLVWGLFGSVAALLLWHFRIIQVATFLAAAGLGTTSRRASRGLGPANKADNWPTMAKPATGDRKLNPMALVTYHAEYHAFDPQCAMDSLRRVTQLGTGWVRTDLRWREIVTDGKRQDPKALSWYRSFLQFSSQLGLKNMVVLSTPPDTVLGQSLASRLVSWQR